jgi:hypothetical protein
MLVVDSLLLYVCRWNNYNSQGKRIYLEGVPFCGICCRLKTTDDGKNNQTFSLSRSSEDDDIIMNHEASGACGWRAKPASG